MYNSYENATILKNKLKIVIFTTKLEHFITLIKLGNQELIFFQIPSLKRVFVKFWIK